MPRFRQMLDGYRRFRETGWTEQRERWSELSSGQSPEVMVIACSDSRVDPAQIFDARPGEMFVVRNVAALVPPYEEDEAYHGVSAALEFAVTQIEVKELVVMGHGACGGCAAALTDRFRGAESGAGRFIGRWVDMLSEARDRVRRDYPELGPEAVRAMEHEGVRISLRNLLTFPFVRHRVEAGTLRLHGAYFAIADGVLSVLDEESGEFRPA